MSLEHHFTFGRGPVSRSDVGQHEECAPQASATLPRERLTKLFLHSKLSYTSQTWLGRRPFELPPPPTIHAPGADPWQLMCPGTVIIRS